MRTKHESTWLNIAKPLASVSQANTDQGHDSQVSPLEKSLSHLPNHSPIAAKF